MVAAGFLALGVAGPVVAQEQARNETVSTRARPDYDAVGGRAGGFLYFPTIDIEQRANDNIFLSDGNEREDFITVLRPALSANSDWNNHALGFTATADIFRYWDYTRENHNDWSLGSNGRYDISREANITGSITTSESYEDRGSPDDAGGREPTQYMTVNALIAGQYKPNRFSINLTGTGDLYNYDDTPTTTGITNNDDRDREEAKLELRLGYDIQPEYEAFLRGSVNNRDYDAAVDDNGLNRDSDGYELVAGARIDFTGLLFGDLFAGYTSQDYDARALRTIDGPTVGAGLFWNPTGLTSLGLNVARSIQETTQVNASGYWSTSANLSIDHELLRNFILSATAGYTNSDYEGISREDDDLTAGAGARYLLNRNFHLSGNYEYKTRDSSVAGSDYEQSVFTLRLTAQL
jgi:hypothetical protein